MSAHIIGIALHPAADRVLDRRLEEMVYHTAVAALADACVSRGQLDSVTLGACDELDGRSISSMLMAMPAGAYLTDEIKVTDSGASALCLATARLMAEECELGMVASWCKSSKTDVAAIMRLRGDPFYTRPLGLDMAMADGLFAQGVSEEFGIAEDEVNGRVTAGINRAARNPRGLQRAVPQPGAIAASPYVATPLRDAQRAPLSDGAVCLVVASERWLRRHPGHRSLARIAGVGMATDSYRLDRDRLRSLRSARRAWRDAAAMAGIAGPDDVQLMEIEAQTGWHEAAYVRAFGLDESRTAISPSGGPFAQNPLFCTGLIGAAEAALQIAGRAGPVQVSNVRRAAAHSCHGYAQQGNVVMIFEKPERADA